VHGGLGGKAYAKLPVSRDSSGDKQAGCSETFGCAKGFAAQVVDNCALKGGNQVKGLLVQEFKGFARSDAWVFQQPLASLFDTRAHFVNLRIAQDSRLDAAKREQCGRRNRFRAVLPVRLRFDLRKGKRHTIRIAVRSQRINPWSSRVAEPKQLGNLIEGLTGGVIHCAAHIAVGPALAVVMSQIQMRVSPGNHQRECRQGQCVSLRLGGKLRLLKQHSVDMPFKVIDGDQRLAERKRQCLCIADAYQQCTRKTGSFGDCNGVEVAESDSSLAQGRAHHRDNVAKVFARCQLRHNTAIGRVRGDLRSNHVRQSLRATPHHCGRGFVAGAFYAENQPTVHPILYSRQVEKSLAQIAAERIVERLRAEGDDAYFAGGCVRDLVLGRAPADFDVATSARPDAVLKLFPRTFAVGAHFGVILVADELDGRQIVTEVATFRSDGAYSDGRRPESVRFSEKAEEDVVRRDFTMNGMLFDPQTGSVLDFVGGRADLAAKLVRAIGDPTERFIEDKLRMLRAVRFAARLDFEIEARTESGIKRYATQIHQVSCERIRDELTRMLTEGHARRAFELLDRTGLLKDLFPEIDRLHGVEQPPEFHPEGDVWTHTLLLLEQLPAGASPTLAWGALLHDVGKPATFQPGPERIRFNGHVEVGVRIAEDICRRLRFSNDESAQIVALVENHMRFGDVQRMKESTLKRFFRLNKFPEHLALHRMDCLASHGSLDLYNFAKVRYEATPIEEVRPALLLTGRDLIEAGYRPGPEFKRLLALAEDAQLEGTIRTKEEALALIAGEAKQ
jgi:putative nucleotidyltransferase with HDIG domain